jgi:hypothetical protein
MKAKETDMSVEERIATEKAISERIAELTAEINSLGAVDQLNAAALDAISRADNFLRVRGGGEKEIVGRDREELRTLKVNAETAKTAALTAREADVRLRNELADLRGKLEDLTYSASLQEVLNHQGRISAAKQEISQLEKAIAGQEAVIRNNVGPNLAPLYRRRQDLLADQALGQSVDQELSLVNESIVVKEGEAEQAAKRRTNSQNSITGLNSKLSKVKAFLADLEQTEKNVLLHFLMSEAERAGGDFVTASSHLQEAYGRLYGLDSIVNKLKLNKSVLGLYPRCPELPIFNLKAFAGKEMGHKTGLMFSHASFDRLTACAKEEQRIKGLGIHL